MPTPTIHRIIPFFLVALTLGLHGCSDDRPEGYNAEITVTPYGIPHIKADDWGGLGFGFGYHFASDNLCLMSRYLLKVRGQLSLHFGMEGEEAANYSSDVLVRLMLTDSKLRTLWQEQDDRGRGLMEGYAAGYNRYLQEIPEGRHEECRSADWIVPMEAMDSVRLTAYITGLAALSHPALIDALLRPRPPSQDDSGNFHPATDEQTALQVPALTDDDWSGIYQGLGSNAWGLGADVTRSRKPILLGNPHYPWHGERRFYTVHMTIPGEVDVMGAAIYGSPLVNIGFTENFAWSHTVSNAVRFTLFELQLDPENPMRYRYDGHWLPIIEKRIPVQVKGSDGSVQEVVHSVYMTDFGIVTDLKMMLGGSNWMQWPNAEGRLYVLRDAPTQHSRIIPQAIDMVTADSLDAFIAAAKKHVGHTFVNTIAVGKEGSAWYGDISTIPYLTDEHWDRCRPTGSIGPTLSAVLQAVRVGNQPLPVLDGSRSECQWKVVSDAPTPGLMPADMLAELKTRGYVANSNDSYWLTNLHQPIEGLHRVQGGERYPLTLRTQMGLGMIEDRLRSIDGLSDDALFTTDHVKHLALHPRNGAGTRFLEDFKRFCTTREVVRRPETRPGCRALSQWDGNNGPDSQGAMFFSKMWQRVREIPSLHTAPFDPQEPLTTPRGLNLRDKKTLEAILTGFEEQVKFFQEYDLDPSAPLSEQQYVVRNGKRISIPGGGRNTGSFNRIVARFGGTDGWSEIEHGNSYIQVVTWDRQDRVQTEGILTYSQSTDPSSPHYADQTEFYSEGGWIRFPFRAEEVAAEAVSSYQLD